MLFTCCMLSVNTVRLSNCGSGRRIDEGKMMRCVGVEEKVEAGCGGESGGRVWRRKWRQGVEEKVEAGCGGVKQIHAPPPPLLPFLLHSHQYLGVMVPCQLCSGCHRF